MQTIHFDLDVPRILATRALRHIWPLAYLSPVSPTRFAVRPDPPLLGPHHVRVCNRVSLICGSDMSLVRADGDPRIAPAALPSTRRVYLGHELCGQVVEAGEAVKGLRVGDRVALRYNVNSCQTSGIEPLCARCASGQYRLCENQAASDNPACIGGGWGDQLVAHEHQLYRPPDALSDDEVALTELAACAVHAVLLSLPQPGDQVLVYGCGAMGLMAVQALRSLAPEVNVSALARYPFQAEAAGALGAQQVCSGKDGYELTSETTGAHLYRGLLGSAMLLGGFDVIYDCVGNARTITNTLRWSRAGGRVVLVGIRLAKLNADLTPLWYQEVQLVGSALHGREVWEGVEIGTFELAARLFLQKKLAGDGFITHRFPLSQWREAIRTASDKAHYQAIKVAFMFKP